MSLIEAAGWVTFWITIIALVGLGFWSALSWLALVEDFINDPKRWWRPFLAVVALCLLGLIFVVWAIDNVESWAWVPVTL